MSLKRPNLIIILGLLFQLLGGGLFAFTFTFIFSDFVNNNWLRYLTVIIAILLIINGILFFLMKKISIIIAQVVVTLAAFFQVYLFYENGDFSLFIAFIFVLIAKSIFDIDIRVFNEEKNDQLVKDGIVLSQKNKLYLAGLICLIFYILIGSYLVPRSNGSKMIKKFITDAANHHVDCQFGGFYIQPTTNHKTVLSSCVSQKKFPKEKYNQKELLEAISKYIVTPSIKTLSIEKDISTIIIMPIQENVVSCTEVNQGKIINAWYDSYENYCVR